MRVRNPVARRLPTLALIVAQMLLCGGSATHAHGAPLVDAGCSRQLQETHRHWVWGGHGHVHGSSDHGHAHGHAVAGAAIPETHRAIPSCAAAAEQSPDQEHESFALADAFMSVVPELVEPPAPDNASGTIGPAGAPHAAASLTRRPFSAGRPPGARLPSHHDLLPHVLRV
jgi:hypothetical protein